MQYTKFSLKNIISDYRILALAVLVSLLWHLFWLSAIKIVVREPKNGPVKFSGVSFLGPVFERGAMNLKVQPRERVFLEKRYFDRLIKLPDGPGARAEFSYVRDEAGSKPDISGDKRLAAMVDEALGSSKLEPDNMAE